MSLNNERLILRRFAKDLIRDVIPNETLPYLLCLTDADCEQIRHKQDREGPRAAVPILLDRLNRRLGAFDEFLLALEETGCAHLKILLKNAMRDQTHAPEQNLNTLKLETTITQAKSDNLKTPTTETARPFIPSETKKLIESKCNDKKLKFETNQMAKENATNPPDCVKMKPFFPTTQSANKNGTDCAKLLNTTKKNANTKAERSQGSDSQAAHGIEKYHYDTLVCYAKENCEIALEVKQFLEAECSMKVCMDLFNFMPGKAITDNISESIHSSQSIVFLLSREFQQKFMAKWELKNAIYDFNAYGKHRKIIPVLLEECEVPHDLKIYTAIRMCGSRKECWTKLAKALQDSPDTSETNIANYTDDCGTTDNDHNGSNSNIDSTCSDNITGDYNVTSGNDDENVRSRGNDYDNAIDCTGNDNQDLGNSSHTDDHSGENTDVSGSNGDYDHIDCIGNDNHADSGHVANGQNGVDENGSDNSDHNHDIDYTDSNNDEENVLDNGLNVNDSIHENEDNEDVQGSLASGDGNNSLIGGLNSRNDSPTDDTENKTDVSYNHIKSL